MQSESVSIELPEAGVRPWEQLLRDVRDLEQQFDSSIASYMRYVQPASPQAAHKSNTNSNIDRQGCSQLEGDLNTILGDLQAVVGEMAETVKQNRGSKRVLERHHSMYQDYVKEFHRYRDNIQATVNRSQLLSGGGAAAAAAAASSEADVSNRDRLVAERVKIDQAHMDIDMVLEQAFSVRQDLSEQRGMLGGMTARMVDVTERIPGVNLLLGRIGSRKRREKVVLAVVLAFCISVLLFVIF